MGKNSFGNLFQFTSFGESHGVALGCIIDGCPAGVHFDLELLKQALAKRRPGGSGYAVSGLVSDRKEADMPEVLSGVFQNKTLGTPIAIIVRNHDAKSGDYDEVKNNPRPGHADDMWRGKYLHSDHRGGGRSSGRETLARVIAGAVAQMVVSHLQPGIQVFGYTEAVAHFKIDDSSREKIRKGTLGPDDFKMRFPSENHLELAEFIQNAKETGKSYGGVAAFFIRYAPAFLGQPVFHKFKSDLAQACLSVGAVDNFDLGDPDIAIATEGSVFHSDTSIDSVYKYGGIRGGITTGEDIFFKVGFKPTASVLDVAKKGRHDPCIIPRAIPVIEAMCWIVLADHLLWARTDRI